MFPRRSDRSSRRIGVMNNHEWDDVSSISSDDNLEDADQFATSARSDYSRLDHRQVKSPASMRQSTVSALSENESSDHWKREHSFQAIPLDAPRDGPNVHGSGRDDSKGYRYISVEYGESTEPGTSRAESAQRTLPSWQPFWFRPGILWIFCGLFTCLAAVLVFLVTYSRASNGLTDANSRLAYVWRFGPIAFLTGVALLWSRTELQILRYTPWLILQYGGHAHSSAYDLEYTEMLPSSVLWRSLKRKHFLVFVAVATAALLKVQIVLSSSIFQLVTIESPDATEVQLLTSFNRSYAFDFPIGNASKLAYSNSLAMQQFDMDLPFGVADDFAYQTFSLRKDAAFRADADAPLSVDVDGIFMEGECRQLEDYSISNISAISNDDPMEQPRGTFTMDLRFEDCGDPLSMNLTVPLVMGFLWSFNDLEDDTWNCSSLPQQHRQLLYTGLQYERTPNEPDAGQFNHLTAAICATRSYTSKVRVVDDGIRPNVSSVGGHDARNDLALNPWTFLQRSLGDLDAIGTSVAGAVGPVVWLYEQKGQHLNASDGSLYKSEILVEAFEAMSKTFMPFLSHYVLRQDTKGQVEGMRLRQVERLRANFGVCVAMAVLFATCALFALFAIHDSRKKAVYFHRDPATILGSLIQIDDGHPATHTTASKAAAAAASAASDYETGKAAWSRGTHTPLILRLWFRTSFFVYLVVLIAWLAYTIQRSQQNEGLIFIDDGPYWPLVFQSLPSLALLLVSLYANSADTIIRNLAVLSRISVQPRSAVELDTSFVDMLGLRALYYSIRYKVPVVTLSQTLAAVCALLPALGSVLLVPQRVPQTTDLMLQQKSWFANQTVTDDNFATLSEHRETLANLNVMRKQSANFTYPPHTYYDLAFPTLDMDSPEWAPGISAKVRTPAAKLRPSVCERLSEDDGDFYISEPWLDPNETVRWDPPIDEGLVCPDNTKANVTRFIDLNDVPRGGDAYFGTVFSSGLNPVIQYIQCSGDRMLTNITLESPPWVVQTYVWGLFERSSRSFNHLSVVRCNYSWMDVVAEVNMRWSDGGMIIDHSNPPEEDKSSMRPWTPAFNIPIFDNALVDKKVRDITGDVFDGFDSPATGVNMRFAAILEPYTSIKLEDLNDPDKDDEVLEALHSNLGFVVAQLANVEQRLDLDEASNSTTSDASREEMRAVRATLTDERLLRVVQNANITYALISILTIAAVVNLWAIISQIWGRYLLAPHGRRPSFVLDMEHRGLAPEGFNSIVMTKALLDGSNVPGMLPRDAQLLSVQHLHRHLAGRQFRLGWFFNTETGANVFTVAALNDDRLVFLGDKLEGEKALAIEGR